MVEAERSARAKIQLDNRRKKKGISCQLEKKNLVVELKRVPHIVDISTYLLYTQSHITSLCTSTEYRYRYTLHSLNFCLDTETDLYIESDALTPFNKILSV